MLGARVFNDFVWNGLRFVPMAQGRWQRECGDGTHLVTSSFAGAPAVAFNTAGNTLGRDFGLFTLGSTMILNPRTSLYGGYDLQVASRYTANMGSAGLQVRW
jgi:outer membrane autotransporter protein